MTINSIVEHILSNKLRTELSPISQLASGIAVIDCIRFGVLRVGVTVRDAADEFSTFEQNGQKLRECVSLRGGDGDVAIDFDRVGLRLDSLDEYCVIASIILGAVIGMGRAVLSCSAKHRSESYFLRNHLVQIYMETGQSSPKARSNG
jgi:hypothetical protein